MASSKFLSLAYHDIFDYPLTEEELLRWEVRSQIVNGEVRSETEKTKNYYHLKGRSLVVKLRQEREKESAKKLNLARKISTKLSTIPTIKFIGVTGSLAMGNAKRESDIDLMVITTDGTLWTTRLIAYLATKLSGYQVRSADSTESKDAICFNMWLDEKHLAVPRKMRNLYTAHEVLQVAPLFNREHTFGEFLDANKWALSFWPKARPRDKQQEIGDKSFKIQKLIAYCFSLIASLFEPIAYFLQKLYMHRHRTRETIETGRAFFHPINWSDTVLREFAKRIEKLSVPLDKLQTFVLK